MTLPIQLRRILTILLIFSTLLFSSCSSKIMYNYLDWIIPWYLDDYVSLTDQQEQFFDQTTERFLLWHRQQELPRYAAFVAEIRNALQEPMTRAQVLSFFDEAEHFVHEIQLQILPDLIPLIEQLSDQQVAEIDAALMANNQKIEEKRGSRDESEQRQLYRERIEDGFDEWFGSTDDMQQQLIRMWSENRINSTSMWLEQRRIWRQEFIALLNQRTSQSFPERLQNLLLDRRQLHRPEYSEAIAYNRIGVAQLVADLSTTLTEKQRIYVTEKLDKLIRDLQDLNAQQTAQQS
jgi:hypothetical protein